MSSRTRSSGSAAIRARALAPSSALRTRYPFFSRRRESMSRFASLSSTTRRLGVAALGEVGAMRSLRIGGWRTRLYPCPGKVNGDRARVALAALLTLAAGTWLRGAEPGPAAYDVRAFGARGDGTTIDTDAINKAIDAAAAAGGGTVHFPAGTYASFSVRLKSHVILSLGAGATLLAADPASGQGRYDAPEPNEHDLYQDFGHSHWQNSLIWGIGVEDVGIVGPGRIDGKGLTRRGPGARWKQKTGDRPLSMAAPSSAANVADDPEAAARSQMEGLGNKAIALKLSRHVLLRDFSILQGGHFAVLATGVDDLTIDNVKIDTNRDGLDIDACRDVRISNTSVNAPNDDAIVLKSTYALGYRRATENVTITNCQVTGYDLGTF